MKINYLNLDKTYKNISDHEYFMKCVHICDDTFEYDNPILSELNGYGLNEGLISTYEWSKVKKYIKDALHLSDGDILEFPDAQGNFGVIIYVPNVNNVIEHVKQVLDMCDYYCSKVTPLKRYYNKVSALRFLPKFNTINCIDVYQYDTIYHITETRKVNKILKIGLVPKATNNNFSYPDRIYFFKGNVSPTDVVTLGRQLINAKPNNKITDYSVLYINTKDIPKNIKFYGDPSYEYGIYTYDNISPNIIHDDGKIDL